MGNCQAVNAAVLVLQHPGGKIDRYYGSISVSEIMNMYPGHYVSLIIPLRQEEETIMKRDDKKQRRDVKFTRVHLLRPTESLILGHAYRLITSKEVMKVIGEKKYAKTKKHYAEKMTMVKKLSEKKVPEKKQGKQLRVFKYKTWKPSLQSISEATS